MRATITPPQPHRLYSTNRVAWATRYARVWTIYHRTRGLVDHAFDPISARTSAETWSLR